MTAKHAQSQGISNRLAQMCVEISAVPYCAIVSPGSGEVEACGHWFDTTVEPSV